MTSQIQPRRLLACCRYIFSRYPFPMYIGAVLLLLALGVGILLGAYWPRLSCYVQSNGVGDMTLRFLPIAGTLGGAVRRTEPKMSLWISLQKNRGRFPNLNRQLPIK